MKKTILNLMLSCGLWQFANAQDYTSNLILHHNFSSNTASATTDASGNGLTANFDANSGGLSSDKKGASNAAYNFAAITGGAGLTVASSPVITDSVMSISVWIAPTTFTNQLGANTNIYKKIVESSFSNGAINYSLFLENGKVVAQINSSAGLSNWKFVNGLSPVLNDWQHIVISWDGKNTAKKMYYYLNGIVQDSVALNKAKVDISALPLKIGSSTNTQAGFTGKLDDIRLYNRVLTKPDVKALFDLERNYSNLEANPISENQFVFYPINNIIGTEEQTNPALSIPIQQLVPQTYNRQVLGTNRFGIANSSITQGGTSASASVNYVGYRIPEGNQFIKPDSMLTIAMWLKNTGTTWNNTTIIDASNNQSENYNWYTNNNGNMVVKIGATNYVFQPTLRPLNSWDHYTMSIDGANKTLKLYINGEHKETVTAPSKFKITNTTTGDIFFMSSPMYFQSGTWQGSGNGLVGNMDEIRFFNKALTGIEIKKIVNPTGKLVQKIKAQTIKYGTSNASILTGSTAANTYTIGNTTLATIDATNNGIQTLKAGLTTIRVQNAGDANYLAIDTTLAFTITKRNLGIIVNNYSRFYGEENPVVGFAYYTSNLDPNSDQYFGFANGDNANLVSGTALFTNTATTTSTIGTYPIGYQEGSLTAENYNIVTYAAGNLLIAKNTPIITTVNDTLIYGETKTIATAKVGVLDLPITVTYTGTNLSFLGTSATALEVGLVTNVAMTVTATSNYNLGYANIPIRILPAPLTLVLKNQTIDIGNNPRTYYDRFNINESTFTVLGMLNGDEYYSGLIGYPALTAPNYNSETSPIGDYTLTAVYDNATNNGNYYFSTVTDATLTIIGKRSQYIEGLNCSTNSDSRIAEKDKPATCNSCSLVFPNKHIEDNSFVINGLIAANSNTGQATGLALSYTVLSGPASVMGNTLTLTGETGTVRLAIAQAGNDEYMPILSENYIYCFDVTTSVGLQDNLSTQKLEVYPNPASNYIQALDFSEVIDVQGNKIAEGFGRIDVSILPKGFYLLKSEKGIGTFIKE